MSTSKGRGAAAHTIGSVVPPEQLRFLFVRQRPETALDFDPEGTDAIPRLFDEFDRLARRHGGPRGQGRAPVRPRVDLPVLAARPARRTWRRPRTSSGPAFAHLALLVQVPGVDVRAARRRREGRAAARGAETAELATRLARGPPLAGGLCARAGADRDPARRPPGRGGAAPPRAARLPARARRGRPRRCPGHRRAVAGRDLRRRGGARPGREGRLQRPLPRVPRPPQRPARRLAAGEPGAGLRHRPADRGRHRRGGDRHERRRAAAPRGARPDPAGGHRQARGPGPRGPGAIEADARRRQLQAESRTRSKAERNAASKQIGEAIRGGAKPDGPEVAELRAASTRRRRPDRRDRRRARRDRGRARGPAPAHPEPRRPRGPRGRRGGQRHGPHLGRERHAGRRRRRRHHLGAPAPLGDRRGPGHHRQPARREDRGLRVPRLQGRRARGSSAA